MKWWVLVLTTILAGCGPGVSVTKVDSATATQLATSVKIIEGVPPAQSQSLGEVEATSCKNKAWDPSPTKENAILQMKSITRQKGGNAIGNLYCEPPLGTSLGNNCWSSIRCTATAFAVQ